MFKVWFLMIELSVTKCMLRLVSSTESKYSVGRGSLAFPMAFPVLARYVEVDSRLSDDSSLCEELYGNCRDRWTTSDICFMVGYWTLTTFFAVVTAFMEIFDGR
jgi:hypothetical protein